MPADVNVTFLTVAGTAIPIPRGAGTREPDGQGKSRWRFPTAPVDDSVRAFLESHQGGTPSGADSERAWDGTLLTDRTLQACGGSVMDPTLGSGTVNCELTVTGSDLRHHKDASTGKLLYRWVVNFTLREG